MVQKLTWGA